MKRCTAHITSGPEAGRRCKLPPIRGGVTCHKHGGSAPQVRAAAARRVAQSEALAVWQRHAGNGYAPVDTVAELARLVAEVVAFKDWAGEQLAALAAGDFDALDPATAATVGMFERSLDRAGRVMADVVRVRLEARLAGLTELQGRAMERVLRGALADLGHDDRDPAIGAAVAARLRLEDGRHG
jgi:hypothetical protein